MSPFNLVPEEDLARLGIRILYPGQAARIDSLVLPPYGGPQPLWATAVPFGLADLAGLGTGSGHLHCYRPPGDRPLPLILFLHGALGNMQCFLRVMEQYHPDQFVVVCPTFGWGSWWHEGGTRTVAGALDFAGRQLNVDAGRVTLAGVSNGATGAVRAVAAYPDRFQSLVLISPVLEPERVTSPEFVAWARNHPVLVIEGADDVNVSPVGVERGVKAMRDAGVTVDYRLLPGHDHFLIFSAQGELFQAMDQSGVVSPGPGEARRSRGADGTSRHRSGIR